MPGRQSGSPGLRGGRRKPGEGDRAAPFRSRSDTRPAPRPGPTAGGGGGGAGSGASPCPGRGGGGAARRARGFNEEGIASHLAVLKAFSRGFVWLYEELTTADLLLKLPRIPLEAT